MSTNSLSGDDREAWRQLRKALGEVGVTTAVIREHRHVVVVWFERAMADEALLVELSGDSKAGGSTEYATSDTREISEGGRNDLPS